MNAPLFNAAAETRGITINVTDKVYLGLVDMAREHSRTPSMQAQLLFEAAYSARCKPTGDRDLDAAVVAMDRPGRRGRSTTAVPPTMRPEAGLISLREAMEGGMAETDAAPAPEPEEPHHEQPLDSALVQELDPAAGDPTPAAPADEAADAAGGAAETVGSALADAPAPAGLGEAGAAPAAVETPRPEAAAEVQPDPVPAPVTPAAAALPGIGQATVRYMRSLKACGNSAAEIAQMTGEPLDAVKQALGLK